MDVLAGYLYFSTDSYIQCGPNLQLEAIRHSSQCLYEQRVHIHRATAWFPPGLLLLLRAPMAHQSLGILQGKLDNV